MNFYLAHGIVFADASPTELASALRKNRGPPPRPTARPPPQGSQIEGGKNGEKPVPFTFPRPLPPVQTLPVWPVRVQHSSRPPLVKPRPLPPISTLPRPPFGPEYMQYMRKAELPQKAYSVAGVLQDDLQQTRRKSPRIERCNSLNDLVRASTNYDFDSTAVDPRYKFEVHTLVFCKSIQVHRT